MTTVFVFILGFFGLFTALMFSSYVTDVKHIRRETGALDLRAGMDRADFMLIACMFVVFMSISIVGLFGVLSNIGIVETNLFSFFS